MLYFELVDCLGKLGQLSRYFISYSRKDAEFVKKLHASLRDAGIDSWLDTSEIHQGEDWADAIQRGLEESNAMLLVISPDSMASRHVSDEWKYYLNNEKPKKVHPIRIKPANIHFQLHPLNYIDFVERDYETAFAALVRELIPTKTLPPAEPRPQAPIIEKTPQPKPQAPKIDNTAESKPQAAVNQPETASAKPPSMRAENAEEEELYDWARQERFRLQAARAKKKNISRIYEWISISVVAIVIIGISFALNGSFGQNPSSTEEADLPVTTEQVTPPSTRTINVPAPATTEEADLPATTEEAELPATTEQP